MRFRVLGPVAAYTERGPVPIGSARQRTVLAVLLTEAGVAVSFDQLVDRVWGESPPQCARQTLHTYLSRLRGVLAGAGGPVLARRSRSYALEAPEPTVDLHRFRALANEARLATDADRAAARWGEALELWRGAPFADLDCDWLGTVATGLEAERLAAVLDRNDVLLRRGEHARLLPELSAAAAKHPLDERLAGQLMLALYRCGRQADALACYRQVHDRLVAELGSDPGPGLRQLHQRILRQEESAAPAPVRAAVGPSGSPAAPPAPAQLPADVAGFTGRAAALRGLDGLLVAAGDPPAPVMVTVIGGCAGIGKTALAVHWAHRVADRFPGGQLYLNLRGFHPAGQAMRPAEALRALLDLLQVPADRIPASVEAQAALYRSRLAGARMLVVLDNARDADQVRPLLPGSPGSMALVTSRDQLSGLVAAEGAHSLRLDTLDQDESRLLLVRRLGAERVAAERDPVDAIIAACAGLPLALAIVAARAATHPDFPLSSFAAELADARCRLDAFSGSDPATDVRAVFACSYQALSSPAARLFRQLARHPGPDIGLAAAASLAGIPPSSTRRSLAELATAHLLTEHTPGRYTLHDLLRSYATELADAEPAAERDEAFHRLLDHYVHTAVRAARLLNSYLKPIDLAAPRAGAAPVELSTHDQALGWFAIEWPVLLGVLRLAAGRGYDSHTWQLARAARDFLDRHGRWHELLTIEQAALTATQRLADPEHLAGAYRAIGTTCLRLARFADADANLRQALDLSRTIVDRRGEASAHLGLAFLRGAEGRYQEGLRHEQQATELYRGIGDPVGEAISLSDTGRFHALLGDYRQALVTCRQAVTVFEEQGHRHGEAHARDNIGLAYHRLGEHQQAILSYQQAVALFRTIGDRHAEAASLTGLGEVHDDTGGREAARDAWQRALEILDEIGHPDAEDLRKRLE